MINTNTGANSSLQTLRSGPEKATWEISTANKFLRLTQGGGKFRLPYKRVEGTNKIFFVSKQAIPEDKKITYPNFVCDIKMSKNETHRVCLTVGGDKITYNGDPISPAISLLDFKIHLNYVISDARKGDCYMTVVIINYYLNKPMSNLQYMQIHLRGIPHEVIFEYSLLSIADSSGYVHVDIRKGMYGLKEAGIISYTRLVRNLQPHGYAPVENNSGLWTHYTLPTTFTLTVDDFGIKLFSADDATHLIDESPSTHLEESTTD